MEVHITLGFLVVALAAYTLFGGADFGGGLLEVSLRKYPELRSRLQATLAPVWEANHVWLIAVIVILFVGFPIFYAKLCTVLFVPLSLALLGITLRGAFFTFRKYDPDPAPRLGWYSALFRAGSVLAPMMFGFIVAALLKPFPAIPGDGSLDFFDLFIAPWANSLGVLCALFINLLFAYLASVFFYGELDNAESREILRARILIFFICTFLAGGGVLAWGVATDVVLFAEVWNPWQLTAQGAALLGIFWLLASMAKDQKWGMRLAVGVQLVAILAGWFSTQYPVLLHFDDGTSLTVTSSAAPVTTLFWLDVGLVAVLAVVLPLLAYLYKVFSAQGELHPKDAVTVRTRDRA